MPMVPLVDAALVLGKCGVEWLASDGPSVQSLIFDIDRWCGRTDDHCLRTRGCQSGCAGATPGTSATPSTSTESAAEPVLGVPTFAPPTGEVTTDGNCGALNGNTVCGNWPEGGCCSLYGVCLECLERRAAQLIRYSFAAERQVIAVKVVKADHAWGQPSSPPQAQRLLPPRIQAVHSGWWVKLAFQQCMRV
jgi:hypothetical protein